MGKQRMQKTGCSMLVAALVGLLPIVAGHAQEAGRTYGQESESESMGTQAPIRQDMDEVQLQGSEQQGAEGPLREDMNGMQFEDRGAEGPLRQDTDLDMQLDAERRGAEGPIREDTDSDAMPSQELEDSGAEGPMRQDTDSDSDAMPSQELEDSGAEGPMRQDTDTMQPHEFEGGGAEGPIRQDMEAGQSQQQYYERQSQWPMQQGVGQSYVHPQGAEVLGAEGPIRNDSGYVEYGSYHVYVGDANPFIDPGGIQNIPYEAGARGPMRTDPMSPRSFRVYEGEANPFIDPGSVRTYFVDQNGRLLDESGNVIDERGMRGPLRTDAASRRDFDMLMRFHNYVGEANPFIDPNGVSVQYRRGAFSF